MGITTGTAALIGGIASAGAGVAGSAISASAAGNAAAAQQSAAAKGMTLANQNLQSALGVQQGATQQIQGFYQPYLTLGQQGAQSLAQALGPQGSLAQGWTQQFQAPTAAQAAQYPGYQFALNQGLSAIQNSAAAKGTLLGTGTMKGLANYATGLASQTYQQSYNNALSGYQTNYQTWLQNQQNLYNRYMGLTAIGAQGAGQLGQLTQQGAGNVAGLYSANTGAMAQLLGAQGAAQASGQIGAANAWSGGLNQIGGGISNLAGQYVGLQALQNLGLGNNNPQMASQGDLQNTMNTVSPFGQTYGLNSLSVPPSGQGYGLPSNVIGSVYGYNPSGVGGLSTYNPETWGTTFGLGAG